MKLYNTLTKKVEKLEPIESGKIKFYTCGPTVYDFAHIGNLRTYVFNDVLRRSIELNGFEVNHVMNITDVDDKTIKASGGEKGEFEKLTEKYEKAFFTDLKKLNIKKAETIVRATEYIDQMVKFIKDLLDKDFAYKGGDKSIYFSIKKFKNYGKLSKVNLDELKTGARVNQDEYSKENPADFVLWKAWGEDDGEIFWNPSTWLGVGTELGKGRPGWHIECSAMSMDRLGDTLDIHTGGVDNIFPHHENEIAQSEARTGKKFAKFWIHGEHLLVDGKKMSKSLGNFYKLKDIVNKGFSPLDFRYLVLQSHYRSKLNFTWKALESARNSRKRLVRIAQEARDKIQETNKSEIQNSKYSEKFNKKINNDLNTPEALAVVWEMVRDRKVLNEEKASTIEEMEEVLALDLLDNIEDEISEDIKKLAKLRDRARANKNFEESDKLRDQIIDAGYKVEDGGSETKVLK